jgi:hypothetical protein
MHRHLEGTVEADELYHTAGMKGQAKQGGKNTCHGGPIIAVKSVSHLNTWAFPPFLHFHDQS